MEMPETVRNAIDYISEYVKHGLDYYIIQMCGSQIGNFLPELNLVQSLRDMLYNRWRNLELERRHDKQYISNSLRKYSKTLKASRFP